MHLLLMDGEEHRGALIEWPQMAWGIKVAGAVVRKLTQAKLQSNEWILTWMVWVRLQNINHFLQSSEWCQLYFQSVLNSLTLFEWDLLPWNVLFVWCFSASALTLHFHWQNTTDLCWSETQGLCYVKPDDCSLEKLKERWLIDLVAAKPFLQEVRLNC